MSARRCPMCGSLGMDDIDMLTLKQASVLLKKKIGCLRVWLHRHKRELPEPTYWYVHKRRGGRRRMLTLAEFRYIRDCIWGRHLRQETPEGLGYLGSGIARELGNRPIEAPLQRPLPELPRRRRQEVPEDERNLPTSYQP